MAWTSQNDLDRWFTYQRPDPEDVPRFAAIRSKAKELAEAILAHTPPCADQSAAIRLVREAVMTANAAIACRKRDDGPNAYLAPSVGFEEEPKRETERDT